MRYVAILFLLYFSCTTFLSGQALKGKVVNEEGQPVPYAIIFIKELSQGTSANDSGRFEIRLKQGVYSCSFQSLGHQTTEQTVEVGASGATVRVVLQQVPFMLSDANVGVGKVEDPAYRIMRKAIGMAPYHLNLVSEYKSSVYLKGTLKVNKISGLIKATAGKDLKETGIKEGQMYLQESVNEVTYKLPAKYTQKVKSVSSTFPEGMGDFYFTQMQVNIYDTESEIFLSPLSPSAFASYRFTYEGCSIEGSRIVNKIRVTPKQNNPTLLRGYLYIDEDTWSVKEFDLSGENIGVKFRNRQSFAEVSKDIFLPISYLFDFDISIMNNEAVATYKSVVKYESITVNPNAKKLLASQAALAKESTSQAAAPVSAKKLKLDARIAELLAKEKLDNRDAMKLADLMSKSAEETRKENLTPEERKKDPLELERRMKLEVDSLAKKRDTAYWAEMRPIPLSTPEVRSYVRKDSLKLVAHVNDSLGKKNTFTVGGLLLGKRYYLCDSSAHITHDGLLNPLSLQFNPVDGFSYGQKLDFNKRFKDTTSFSASLNARYAFSREVLMGSLTLGYSYWPQQRAKLQVRGGRSSADFNARTGLSAVTNTYTALIAHSSYINLYDNTFFAVNNAIDLANGLTLTVDGALYNRKPLVNTTEYSFFYRSHTYRSNTPQNPYVAQDPSLLDNQRAAVLSASLSYTPKYYYRKNGKLKRMVRSDYPTFTASWQKGLPDVFNSAADFDFGQFSVKQEVELGLLKSFTYKAEAGKFFNRKQLHFADFWHANVQEPSFLFGSPADGAYYLPRTYESSTNNWYLSALAGYQTPCLLLKYLPLIRNTYWREGVHLSYLQTPTTRNYTEVGYSLTGIGLIGGVGVFAGFSDFSYSTWGFKLTLMLISPPER